MSKQEWFYADERANQSGRTRSAGLQSCRRSEPEYSSMLYPATSIRYRQLGRALRHFTRALSARRRSDGV